MCVSCGAFSAAAEVEVEKEDKQEDEEEGWQSCKRFRNEGLICSVELQPQRSCPCDFQTQPRQRLA